MARLAIYKGNALVRDVDVPEGTLRVGRSDQNDIVLIDPGKAVSRFHAELRVGQGTCVIADLNSQNGTWVAGRRVQQATLTSGQAVVVGTHRLVFKADDVAHEVDHAMAGPAAAQPAEMAPVPPVAGEPTPHARVLAPAVPVEEKTAPSPASSVHRIPVPTAARVSAPVAKPGGWLRRALLFLAGSICVAAVGVAGGMSWWPVFRPTPAASPRVAVDTPPQPVPGGPPTETPVSPALASPGDALTPASPAGASVSATRAVAPTPAASTASARAAAATATAATVPISPTSVNAKRAAPTVREKAIERARAAIGRGDYVAALGFLQPVMRVDAGNPEALDLLAAVRAQGHDAFMRGRQLDAVGRSREAVAMYERAARLLPPDHPSAQTAKARVAALR